MPRIVCLLILILAVPVVGARVDRDAQIASATTAARLRLAEELARETVGGGWSVGDWFDRMGRRDRFDQLIASADVIGGARWIDDSTCQVRVALSGDLVSEMILTLALAEPHRTPVPYGILEDRLKGWKRRSFSATGIGMTWDRAAELTPPPAAGEWRDVPVSARRAALLSARDDARRRFVESLRTSAESDPQLQQDLSDEARVRVLGRWVDDSPVSSVVWRDDGRVEVTVAVPVERLARDAGVRLPSLPMVTGESAAPAPLESIRRPSRDDVIIPMAPPAWAGEILVADATAGPGASELKTARAAESAASDALRERILRLDWGTGSIADALPTNPALSSAVERALVAARVTRVEYLADGSVRASLSVSGRRLWSEITADGGVPPRAR